MLLPRKKIAIVSSKSVEQIIRTLQSMTDESTSVFRIKDRNKLFYGKIKPPEFVLHSTPEDYYRNNLLEISIGLRRDHDSVTVDLDVRPWRYERVFAAIFFSFCIFFAFSSLVSQKPIFLLIPAGMSVFCYLLIRLTFDHLFKKLVNILTETLS